MRIYMSKRDPFLMRLSTTMSDFAGVIHGSKEDSILEYLVDSLTKLTGKQSTVECPIPLHGLLNTLHSMVNRFYGTESSE